LGKNGGALTHYSENENSAGPNFQAGGSSSSSSGTGPQSARKVLWFSRGAEVFLTAGGKKLPSDPSAFKNNQILTKEDIVTYYESVDEAKLKEVENYCVHRAFESIRKEGFEWNTLTGVWVLTFKWTSEGWKVIFTNTLLRRAGWRRGCF
jgi:hypothetical protein